MIGLYYLSKMARECARYLATESLWSSWKSDEPYDVILMMQPRCLAKDLMRDIKATYYGEANPVKLFLEDIEQEYETILQWIQFRNTLHNFRLNLGGEFDTMENKLMLLEHMRKTVYWWRSQELSKE